MNSRKKNRHKEMSTPLDVNRRVLIAAASVLALAIVISLSLWWWTPRRSDAPRAIRPRVEPRAPISPAPASPPAAAAAPKADFQKLKGQWLRPDGGYVLEIKSVGDSGQLDASYANPQPIHVAKAEASHAGQAVKVFVELRDVNYPGCTYDLTYDLPHDALHGIYYQAALKQQFEVVFVRMNEHEPARDHP